MSHDTIFILWVVAVLFLFLAMVGFIAAFFGVFRKPKPTYTPLDPRQRGLNKKRAKEDKEFEDHINGSYDLMENTPSLEEVQKQQKALWLLRGENKAKKRAELKALIQPPIEENITKTFLAKYKTSRAKRKQAPNSQASPVIKSLVRGKHKR